MITVEQVSKSFPDGKKRKLVLDDISFHIKKGEVVSLLGESGCGKSTLLQIVGGFLQSDTGRVLLGETIVTEPSRDCMMLFQQYNLLPWLNVLDNVLFGLTGEKEEKREKALDVLRFVGLEDDITRYPKELSGGMQQRVAIARAFALEPLVILMDEPFAALDTFNRYHLQDELVRLQAQDDTSMLLVTHDIDEAIYVSDRIIVLTANPGEIYETIDITLPKPRDRSSELFSYYRKKILQTFQFSRKQRHLEFYI